LIILILEFLIYFPFVQHASTHERDDLEESDRDVYFPYSCIAAIEDDFYMVERKRTDLKRGEAIVFRGDVIHQAMGGE
jgi:hypothetical protein